MPERTDAQASKGAIRADIERTRARMSETLDEIGERLNPQHVKAQVKHSIREATLGKVEHMARRAADRANDARQEITETIRENPIPLALVGLGLGWLLWNRRRERWSPDVRFENRAGSPYRSAYAERGGYSAGRGRGDETTLGYGASGTYDDTPSYGSMAAGATELARERITEAGETVKERTRELTSRAHDTVGQVASRTQDVASSVADEARYRASRVEDQFYENPLAVGAAVVAVGLAAGLALPATRKEAELMGGARDRLVDRARETARETKEKVRHVAERVVDETTIAAKEAAQQEGLTG